MLSGPAPLFWSVIFGWNFFFSVQYLLIFSAFYAFYEIVFLQCLLLRQLKRETHQFFSSYLPRVPWHVAHILLELNLPNRVFCFELSTRRLISELLFVRPARLKTDVPLNMIPWTGTLEPMPLISSWRTWTSPTSVIRRPRVHVDHALMAGMCGIIFVRIVPRFACLILHRSPGIYDCSPSWFPSTQQVLFCVQTVVNEL